MNLKNRRQSNSQSPALEQETKIDDASPSKDERGHKDEPIINTIIEHDKEIQSNITVTRQSSKATLKQSSSVERLHMGFLGSSTSTAQQILLQKPEKSKSKSKLNIKHARILSDDQSLKTEKNDSIDSFN